MAPPPPNMVRQESYATSARLTSSTVSLWRLAVMSNELVSAAARAGADMPVDMIRGEVRKGFTGGPR